MLLVKLHFIDCVFTSSFTSAYANRNLNYDPFIYPLEWNLNKSNFDKTLYVLIHHREDEESKDNDNCVLIANEAKSVRKKLRKIIENCVYNIESNNRISKNQSRSREISSISRVENYECYIGYRLHYHLMQMIGKQEIKQIEYLVIGSKSDLKEIAEFTNCYQILDLIKQKNLHMKALKGIEIKIVLDNNALILKAIVEPEGNDNLIRCMYPIYLARFTKWSIQEN